MCIMLIVFICPYFVCIGIIELVLHDYGTNFVFTRYRRGLTNMS